MPGSVPTLYAADGAPRSSEASAPRCASARFAHVNCSRAGRCHGGLVILAEDAERRTAGRGANRKGYQVNLVPVIFADRAIRVRSPPHWSSAARST